MSGMGDTPPREPPATGKVRKPSLVVVNTGDGKGKSTAAFGIMIRAVARGWKVAVIQFLKSGDWKVGEETVGRRLGVDWWALGDGFTWDADELSESEAVARTAWDFASERIMSGDYDLVILDEVTYPMNWGWIDPAEVVETIRNRPPSVNIVATGRDASESLMSVADTVTEMVKVKHPYDEGVMSRRGIDF